MGIPCGHESIFTPEGIKEALLRLQHPERINLSECSLIDKISNKKIKRWVNPSRIVADSSYMAAPFLKNPEFRSAKIIHLYRNPLEVIASFVYDGKFFLDDMPDNDWEWLVYDKFPEIFDETTPLERAAKFYFLWNKLIEKSNGFKQNIDGPITPELLNFLEVENYNKEINNKINSWNVNSRPKLVYGDLKNPTDLIRMYHTYDNRKIML